MGPTPRKRHVLTDASGVPLAISLTGAPVHDSKVFEDLIDEVYASDVVWHEPDGADIHGTEEAKRFVSLYKTAFPDLEVTVEDVVAERDRVVTRVTLRGTHRGETEEFGTLTGRQVEGTVITISRIEGGKIVENWDAYDNLSLLHRLGLAPEQ